MQATSSLIADTAAAKYLGVSVETLRGWRIQGRHLPYHKVGRCVRYSTADLDEFLRRGFVAPRGSQRTEICA
jgi:excisionase family DNA binding protein